ncbi:J domain-containing protein [Natronosalvus caseinilyticus]|uniref:J domain-containing protein n=1 Tax=Natronosalvus caseinilyticus TaxID=2953747 RepID=UPI0028B0E974|nr:J domain-containing protein [Natronosalvus caseinilyticus]
MPTSVLEAIPPAILWGLVLGGIFTGIAATLFVVGERLFPSRVVTGENTYSSERRRRGEIRTYLQAIDERYLEEWELEDAGETVAFYLPERDVAVTFDAEAFVRLQARTATYLILAEHEMPGVHLSDRLPFEVPPLEREHEREYGTMTVEDRLKRAYEALGVSTTADAEAIREAYRERVKAVHPDHGGDEESFQRVQEAYATVREHAD